MLHSIRELSEQQVHSSTPREMAPIYHTLSLLHYVLRENEKVGSPCISITASLWWRVYSTTSTWSTICACSRYC